MASPWTTLLWFFCIIIVNNCMAAHRHGRAHRHEISRLKRHHGKDHFLYRDPSNKDVSERSSGDWGPWGEQTPCSRTCGGGVQSESRSCLGGSCQGPVIRYSSCNLEECPEGSNFRAEQCSEYNSVSYEGINYEWVPYLRTDDKCALNCKPLRQRFYYRHKDQVFDGTSCSDDDLKICVNGVCTPLGCDKILGSPSTEDECRVCGGDGSTCKTQSGILDENPDKIGYMDLLYIPAGATNIKIIERQPSNNYLAVRNEHGQYYLNGDWHVDTSKTFKFAGTKFVYKRNPFPYVAPESLTAIGPTNEALVITLLYQETNTGIEYRYSVPVNAVRQPSTDAYDWVTDEFTPCSATCGGGWFKQKITANEYKIKGFQKRNVWCGHESDVVDNNLCNPITIPVSTRICASQACPAQWRASNWSRCSAPCGEPGTKTRQVYCEQIVGNGHPLVVDDSMCDANGSMPHSQEECQQTGPCPLWHTGPWKPCDHLCGEGVQTRELHCYRKENGKIELLASSECQEDPPEAEKSCNLRPCDGVDWITSDWSGCKGKCGLSSETRTAQCANEKGKVYNDSMCQDYRKPELVRNCTSEDECESQWYASQWSECSAKCGSGLQTREVFCATFEKEALVKIADEKCDSKLKYQDQQECKVEEECKGEWFAGPFGECSKPCGGGVMSRTVLCLRNNKTTKITDCKPESIPLSNEECNPQACGEDEIIPVEPTQMVTEEDSEECEDDYDYEDTTEDGSFISVSESDLSTSGVFKLTDELEGSGGFSDDISSTLLITDLPSTTSGDISSTPVRSDSTTIISESTSVSSGSTDLLKDEAATDSSEETSSSTETSVSMSSSSDGTSVSMSSSSEEISVSMSTIDETSDSSPSSSGTTDASSASSDSMTPSDATTVSDMSSTDQSSSVGSSEGSSTDQSSSTESSISSTISVSSSDSSSVSESDGRSPEPSTTDISTTIDAISTTDDSSSSSSSSQSSSDSSSTEGSSTAISTDGSSSLGSTDTSVTDVTDSSSTDSSTLISSSTDSSTMISSTDSSTDTSGSETSSWSETVFGVTTPSNADLAITKEQMLKKCKKRKGKSKCIKSAYGCCPDGKTAAKGPFSKGCEIPKTCNEAKHGCCPDGVSAATGSNNKGCPKSLCNLTLFGCCADGVSTSMGNNYEGCPILTTTPVDCSLSKFGCCPDGILSAMGPNFKGCVSMCGESPHGCCPDNFSPASGPDFKGCDIITEECSETKDGCCPDGITAAKSADFKDCPNCNSSIHGCCPDEVLAARGANYFGCPATCSTSDFGCCEDNVTRAHGPNREGCCLKSPYGCCPDNIVAAHGPNYLNCNCTYSPYGCCPDNTTAAKGYENKGCGCEHTPNGCCPDQITPAEGPEYAGCSCHTYQFGCCPDGITIVKGPWNQGCRCEEMEFGCCPDDKTPKTSKDQNCTCDASKYGCCPDGIMEAKGENFEGCENVPLTPEICGLPKDSGEFTGAYRDYKKVYFFNSTYGGCAKMWYYGNKGNANRFPNQESCTSFCVNPPGKSVCKLPGGIRGSCGHDYPRWYFDSNSKQCYEFSYSGCLGNANNFETRESCLELCGSQEHLDPCEQTQEPGPCNGTFERWYYDKNEKSCLQFNYGGCKGLQNNFRTEAACQAKCLSPTKQKEECRLANEAGICNDEFAKWYFNNSENKCMPFYYTGCGGNNNQFNSEDECNSHCPIEREKDLCMLPADGGTCYDYVQRHYYDTAEKACKVFYYGGCGGNENNFVDESSCQRQCEFKKPEPPKPVQHGADSCYLPVDKGPCSGSVRRWAYQHNDGACVEFEYGGCEGNGNSFRSEEECQNSCGPIQDPCKLPKVAGPCGNWTQQWHYDESKQECSAFYYGGCMGNTNRFNTIEDCERSCRVSYPYPQPDPNVIQPVAKEDICEMPMDTGPCTDSIEQYHYDIANATCVSFKYGGCDGNANRFATEEMCERQCGKFKTHDTCSAEFEYGSCSDSIEKYYFDTKSESCKTFDYSGCGGNPNRFSNLEECETLCLRKQELPITYGENTAHVNKAICGLPMEHGRCDEDNSSILRYFYDEERRACVSFIYSGCAGNLNNFASNEDCINYCIQGTIGQENEVDDCQRLQTYCDELRATCSYNLVRWVDNKGCDSCRCQDPCETNPCIDPTLCEARYFNDPETGVSEYRAFCREGETDDYKPGECPSPTEESIQCDNVCSYDTDCPGNEKCCYNGCAYSCLSPYIDRPPVTQGPAISRDVPPYIRDDSPTEATAEVGNLASLRCEAEGTPVPTVTWLRNSETLNGTLSSKYRISQTGDLEIIGIDETDEGDYICKAENGIGRPAHRSYTLQVLAGVPREVTVLNKEDEKEVVVTLGSPAVMRCYAIGYPKPLVSWWQDKRMLPIDADGYERRSDNSLFIRTVSLSHLGVYTCHLYNGQGSPGSIDLTLKVFGPIHSLDPNDLSYNKYIVTSKTSLPVDERPYPQPRPSFPSQANITSNENEVPHGGNATLACTAVGNPRPKITWYKDGELLYSNDRITIADEKVLITKARVEDSGTYTCLADNGIGRAEPSIKITVKQPLPLNCTDSPYFANCALIVQANYCNHLYYAKFCCASCTEAGKLEAPYRVKRQAVFLPSRITPLNFPRPKRIKYHPPQA